MSVESVEYVPDPRYFSGTNGDVYRHLGKLGREIERGAKRMVGVDSGALRDEIHYVIKHDQAGPYVEIGANLPYAKMHHDGTRPHVIAARNTRFLRFTQRGKVVYAQRVYHPGTRPNRYLTVPMTLVVSRD